MAARRRLSASGPNRPPNVEAWMATNDWANETAGSGAVPLTASEPYRSARTLARVVVLLLAAYVVAALLSMGSGYLQLRLLERAGGGHTEVESIIEGHADEQITDAEAEANDQREAVTALLLVAVFVANVVVFLLWLHRSYSNLPALGNPKAGLEYSPGWVVGGWFIPFVNLVVPYRVVREVWAKSDPAVGTDEARFGPTASSSLILAWWLVWLASNVVGNISFRLVNAANSLPDFVFATRFDIFAGGFNIISALLAILVVRSIERRQEARSSRVVYVPPGPPPPLIPPQAPAAAQGQSPPPA
jgi:hypothetical protein